jgi:hypothetical protein
MVRGTKIASPAHRIIPRVEQNENFTADYRESHKYPDYNHAEARSPKNFQIRRTLINNPPKERKVADLHLRIDPNIREIRSPINIVSNPEEKNTSSSIIRADDLDVYRHNYTEVSPKYTEKSTNKIAALV